ncbi:ATP-binding cassette, subfamily F, member 3 [Lacrimispora sphenoides]|jgi:ATP-binding cassette subfamily F protein 3|uniref:ATP-binding cassette domain-containing protein n=1 Tax=Lacrimispora sphenoides TaxID=29370 RepID=UPI0008BBF267|nr:ATP-binding cassette domain-containing protein [Lacrimispora sphenoides]SEU10904.1 ATP-binding cassette, subfamily F, member 3 [Lacrimispora sphenoides]
MIKVQNLSYSYPQKDLYKKVSFTIEDNVHCALIGTNGTGKSTLLDLIMHSEEYLYDGKIEIDNTGRIGYVSQFSQLDPKEDMTVFQYISDEFVKHEQKIFDLCKEMETAVDLEGIFEEYQKELDEWNAIDGESHEINIKKQLKLANLQKLEEQKISSLSGGEFKLVQVIREMMLSPRFLIMDEPDVFLDFNHLNALRNLINAHKGTLLIITHNRYLLNHCFNKILHMENMDVQEFDGTYTEYNYELLATKIDLEEAAAADQAEIDRQSRILQKSRARASEMDNPSLGRAVHARQTLVDRLKARKTKAPFVDIKQPEIYFDLENEVADENILELTDYSVAFDEQLLEHVNFEMKPGEHVAIVGSNGTGKTTMLCEVFENKKDTIRISEGAKVSMFSQITGSLYDDTKTLLEIFEEKGFDRKNDIENYLKKYGFEGETLGQKVSELSGGEKDLFQLAMLSLEKANFLLLDEPTGHLDVYAQIALEQAISGYKGAILMVSHDYYTVANCMDYVLLVENNTVRRMSIRKFRQMIYANHFDKDYLLLEQKKKETETRIQQLLRTNEFEMAKVLMESLEEIIKKMKMSMT